MDCRRPSTHTRHDRRTRTIKVIPTRWKPKCHGFAMATTTTTLSSDVPKTAKYGVWHLCSPNVRTLILAPHPATRFEVYLLASVLQCMALAVHRVFASAEIVYAATRRRYDLNKPLTKAEGRGSSLNNIHNIDRVSELKQATRPSVRPSIHAAGECRPCVMFPFACTPNQFMTNLRPREFEVFRIFSYCGKKKNKTFKERTSWIIVLPSASLLLYSL